MVCATDTTDLGISTPSLSRPSTNNFTTSYLPIYGKREPVDQRPRVAVSTTVFLGVVGYLSFGDATLPEVTLNLPHGAWVSTGCLALVAVSPLSKFALTLEPVARGVDSALGLPARGQSSEGRARGNAVRGGLGLGSLGLALSVPGFAFFTSLLGCFLTVIVSVAFPCGAWLKLYGDTVSPAERAANVGVIALGALASVSGAYAVIADSLG